MMSWKTCIVQELRSKQNIGDGDLQDWQSSWGGEKSWPGCRVCAGDWCAERKPEVASSLGLHSRALCPNKLLERAKLLPCSGKIPFWWNWCKSFPIPIVGLCAHPQWKSSLGETVTWHWALWLTQFTSLLLSLNGRAPSFFWSEIRGGGTAAFPVSTP